MKRVGNLLDTIVDVDNLALAAYKAFRGKSHALEVLKFRQNFIENILEMKRDIINGEIVIGHYNQFIIYEPKERLICAAPLKQRILHHAIMNVCHHIFDRQLIYDSYASRPSKGSHKAILRIKDQSKHYRYFVKLDIRKFFDSVDHSVLKTLLNRLIKDSLLHELFTRIIDSYGSDKGLPIGNLTSQYFANYYLSPLDHYMKETVKSRVYVRYMDDVVIMEHDREKLKSIVRDYCRYADDVLKLQVKPPIFGNVCNGIPFLGYKVYRERILINGKGKRRFRRNLKILDELFEDAVISEREYLNRLLCNFAYVDFANSYRFKKKIFG